NNGNMPEKLRLRFKENGISLSENPDISDTDVEWLIIDDGRTYIVRKEEETLRIYVDWKTFIATYFSIFMNVDEAVEKLFELSLADFIPEKEERLRYVQAAIRDYLCRSFIIEKTASIFSLSLSTTEQLLTRWVRSLKDSKTPSITEYLESGFIESEELLTMEDFRDQFATSILLQKIAMIITKLKVKTEELPLLFQRNSDVWGNRGWADLNSLPLSTLEDPSALFGAAEKLFDLFKFRDMLLPGEPTLFEIMNMAFDTDKYTFEEFLKALSERTGWKMEDLQQLADWFGFELAGFEHMEALVKFMPCFEIMKRLGVSAEKVCDWISIPEEPDEAMEQSYQNARSIKQTAKAKYDNERWLTVAKPLRDDLREKQRSALVSYIVASPYHLRPILKIWSRGPAVVELQIKLNAAGANPALEVDGIFGKQTKLAVVAFQAVHEHNMDGIVGPKTWAALESGKRRLSDANDLYDHFLIDPEMSPCMMTSRLKLAISTVQLFIQRCLMNLEEWKIPNAIVAQEWSSRWEWIKNYRVWEANRKIFLYPENWIEPELRDDKSSFFKDLENELLQNEITAENVEKGFLNYLEKLDPVARLEICGMYHEVEKEAPDGIGKNAIDTLHIFGRTCGMPHIYYYRRRIATGGETMYWTPWERVDLDIEGDHLIPVVWNRRLFLFWPVFTEKAKKGGEQGEEPPKYWEIQMAWSEYKNGKWSAKEVTPESEIPEKRSTDDIKEKWAGGDNWPMHLLQSEFSFKGFVTKKKLSIQCLIHEHKTLIDSGVTMGTYPLFNIEFIGCQGRIIPSDIPAGLEPLSFPHGTDAKGMELIESEYRGEEDNLFIGDTILEKTPGIFHLLFPHQYYRFNTQDSFFYQDDTRTFIVTPRGTGVSDPLEPPDIYRPDLCDLPEWHNPNKVQPEQVESFFPDYYEFIPQYEHWEEMVPPTENIDPPIFDQTYRIRTHYDETVGDGPDYGFFSTRARTETRMLTKSKSPSLLSRNTSMAMTYYTMAKSTSGKRYLFETFYHPYVCEFVKRLNREGIDGLFQRYVQMLNPLLFSFAFEWELGQAVVLSGAIQKQFVSNGYPLSDNLDISFSEQTVYDENTGLSWILKKIIIKDRGSIYSAVKIEGTVYVHKDLFEDVYLPTDIVDKPYPYEDVDFESDGSYSLYNWEIFFHAPLMVADRLSKNQRFAEAQKLFHYIFDPTDTSTHDIPQKYWKFRPFFEATAEQPPQTLVDLLTKEQEELKKQVKEWRENAFKPHLIARMRIMAYQKTVVMKYIDNLIAWGDQLFRRDTIESINEATQLYILAAEILGKRSEDIPPHTEPPVKTFNDLIEGGELDALSNRMVEEENYLSSPKSAASIITAGDMQMFGPSFYLCCPAIPHDGQEDKELLYFCIPKNQKLLSYWDTVADRLFKIRHCITIEGVVRELPLYEPPIEPGLLVRAAAAGVDISSALNDLNAPLPHYRFQYMLQKSIELCADVRSLGASLLSVLEKRDAEKLSMLRSGHEVQLLKAVRQIKEHQIDEGKETIEGSNKALEAAEIRHDYYKNIEKMNVSEKLHLAKLSSAQILQSIGQGYDIAASISHLIPNTTASLLCAGATFGGSNIGSALRAYGGFYAFLASIESYQANRASTLGSHDRRWNDWKLQENIAAKEIDQIHKQILAAEIRLAIAEKDLENHDLQIENAKEVDTYMRNKFTNQELYNWMVSQISTIYFQSYQMAYDIAKRAEKAFQHELSDYDATFIKFGYWDSLKKGLLSGEKLHYDLKRMETGYLEKNKREYEITKHISLAMLDPVDLIKLKETGECFVNIPEAIFDLDYPGHYMRRIKSVSLTIPCITGPYTSLNCTLTLLKNSVRIDSSATGKYGRDENGDDPRFRDNIGAIQSIATSHGQNDSGVFELNFRDERYLPFEGAGAISQWRIELPQEFRQFDYDTISDVILHLRYTAREGGKALRDAAVNQLQEAVNTLAEEGILLSRLFSARHEFPGEWHQFLYSPDSQGKLNFELYKDRFPFMFRDKKININRVGIYLKPKDTIGDSFELNVDNHDNIELKKDQSLGNILCGTTDLSREVLDKNDSDAPEKAAWTIEAENDISELVDKIEDLFVLLYYSIE
ncbi:MAG: peptidoglycan-binding protein, partial [Proteobacteria bacterium]|nr:peptidoglycan-binding protein [Pseudomonadota bacterium]